MGLEYNTLIIYNPIYKKCGIIINFTVKKVLREWNFWKEKSQNQVASDNIIIIISWINYICNVDTIIYLFYY